MTTRPDQTDRRTIRMHEPVNRRQMASPAVRAIGVAGCLAMVVTAGACTKDAEALLSPDSIETFAAVANELDMDELVQQLSLPESKREEFETRLGALHEAMLSVHAKIPESTAGMSKQQVEHIHTSLQAEMETVHQRHHELLQTLDEAQRVKFMEHVHAKMQAHHEALGLDATEHGDLMHQSHPAIAPHVSAPGGLDPHHR